MAAIHSLSDSLQGILVELSEKVEKLEDKNKEMEERTKELEIKEMESKAKIEEMVVENAALQDRISILEQQLNAEVDSKLKDLLSDELKVVETRLVAAEGKILDHDKLVDRLESCEKKLASFYGEDTNILGRVGHLETRFKDFKKNEDIKLAKQMEGLVTCQAQNEDLKRRVDNVEEGLGLTRRLTDILHETKLEKADVEGILLNFKVDNRLLDDDSIVDVVDLANSNKKDLAALTQSARENEERLGISLEKIREDIETLQQNTEPAHKYECFGSDQAVKIFQIETKLKELEGMSTASVEARLALMEGRVDATTSQMDRVLNIENIFNNNFDRIGTDYVHLSRLISDINEELHGNELTLKDFMNEMRHGGRNTAPEIRPTSLNEETAAKLARDIQAVEKMINSADFRMSEFADECKNSLAEMQANNDKKIDILAVWVSKNINLLASSTRKKFKQLLAGDDMGALLSGQSKAGHCLSCNQSKRPHSASHPKTRITEGKSPIFKITHLDQFPYADDNYHHNNSNNNRSLMSDATEGGPAFKMTVPASLRMKVSNFRHNDADERLQDASDSAAFEDREDYGGRGDERTAEKQELEEASAKIENSAQSLPRKFFKNHKNNL